MKRFFGIVAILLLAFTTVVAAMAQEPAQGQARRVAVSNIVEDIGWLETEDVRAVGGGGTNLLFAIYKYDGVEKVIPVIYGEQHSEMTDQTPMLVATEMLGRVFVEKRSVRINGEVVELGYFVKVTSSRAEFHTLTQALDGSS